MVAGRYYYVFVSNSGGTYSREDSLTLCPNGLFLHGCEMYGSGSSGTAYTNRGNAGSFMADGDRMNGTLRLMYRDGKSETLRYQKSGPTLF